MANYKDIDPIIQSLSKSIEQCDRWYNSTKDKEIRARADSAKFTFLECKLKLLALPSANVKEIKQGKWITELYDGLYPYAAGAIIPKRKRYHCSECGCRVGNAKRNYCPDCGTEMIGVEKCQNM